MSEIVKTIKLEDPVSYADEKITELNFKKFTAEHFWKLDMSNLTFGGYLEVAANACGVHTKAMKKLSMRDAAKVTTYVGECLADGQETGSTPSA